MFPSLALAYLFLYTCIALVVVGVIRIVCHENVPQWQTT